MPKTPRPRLDDLLAPGLCPNCLGLVQANLRKILRKGRRYLDLGGALANGLQVRRMSNKEIARLRLKGHTLKAIGAMAGICRERVRQICQAQGLVLTTHVGQGRAKAEAEVVAKAQAGPEPTDVDLDELKKELDKIL